MSDLLHRVRVARVDDGDVDGPGPRVAPDGQGEEPLAEAGRKVLDEGHDRRDVTHGRRIATLELLLQAHRIDRTGRQQGAHERGPTGRRDEERVRQSVRRHRIGEQEGAREGERHANVAQASRPSGGQTDKKWPVAAAAWHRGPVSRPGDFLQRTLPIAMLSLALVAVPVLVLQPEGLPRLRGLQRELDQVETENDELKRDVTRLRIEVQQLRDDPAAVERIARDELGMVRKSEVVFQFGK